ncbi:MAG: DUF7133 domain-containing protein [Planctomycetaceae bacterium]
MSRWMLILVAALCGVVGSGSIAWAQAEPADDKEPKLDAKWIWFDEGNPAEKAPVGKVWFRRVVKAEEPSSGEALIACDDDFTFWVNGQKVGSGGGNRSYRFSLNGIAERGTNVFGVEATNKSGRAGLLIEAEIRGQSGKAVSCDTGPEWLTTRTPPQGATWLLPRFDDGAWQRVKVLGTHPDSPWKDITFATGEFDRFQVPQGFEIARVADHNLVGGLISLTWGNRGRLLGGREHGGIVNIIDKDGDGKYDEVTDYCPDVKHSQGICLVGDDLYAVGSGPRGTGLYLLPDRNRDDQADEVILLINQRGSMGEHGPHDVVFGPDGWLYHNLGNHSWIIRDSVAVRKEAREAGESRERYVTAAEANSPCRAWEEGNVLQPPFEDALGHAVGIKAPGGTTWRFTPDGKKWWAEAVGFRNHYDFAFNQMGEHFTFDSDMEWDVNLPWYRPVRINHCIPGAEFGWRSGAKCMPEWYFDTLPGTVNIGRGSPTGVVFYEHTQFPEKYRGAMLSCDWSMGRIMAVSLKRKGATYSGTYDLLATGNPLNVTDIEVDRDGSVIFSTGGRGTEGAIYRISYTAGKTKTPRSPKAETLQDALAMPQPQANWNREASAAIKAKLDKSWSAGLEAKVKSGAPAEKIRALTLLAQHGPKPENKLLLAAAADSDAGVRQFAALLLGDHPGPETAAALTKLLTDRDAVVQRRACEAFVRAGLEAPVDGLLPLLGAGDRWLQFASRVALERVPVEKWKAKVLEHRNVSVRLLGMLALHRLGGEALSPVQALEALAGMIKQTPAPDDRARLDMRRMLELTLIRASGDEAVETATSELRQHLAEIVTGQLAGVSNPGQQAADPYVRTTAELTAALNGPHAAAALAKVLRGTKDPFLQIHYAMCLRYVTEGWTDELKQQILDWYESTRELEGGNSLQGYIRNIVSGCLERFSAADRSKFLLAWRERPHAAKLVLSVSQPDQVDDFHGVIGKLLVDLEGQSLTGGQELFALTIDVLSKSDAPESQAQLRKLFEQNADRRDLLARALAKHPTAENVPALLKGIAGGDLTTMQMCLQALAAAPYKSTEPREIRAVILAGLKLGQNGGKAALNLLKKWTSGDAESVTAMLAVYQNWFEQKYPDEPAPQLAQEDADKTGFTVQQLVEFLDKPEGQRGDVERGRQVFVKANCVKCHKFQKDGEGVGPDLTSLRRRFQKKDIVESILLPSQVISDQFTAVTVQTVDGLVHTGMPLANSNPRVVELLLSDGTRLEIPRMKVEELAKAKVSVMPEGLLKGMSLSDVADLFAFLETSKNSGDSQAAASAGGR